MGKTKALFFILLFSPFLMSAQGYLHTQGKYIYNGDGEEVILRGIGTGNWMLQEGYMMQTAGIAGTQHEIRAKLEESIGEARTDSFYNAWLQYHFTRTDVDSMKSWGYNSVRVAMHYKWFTLPIEQEPVEGENTWLDKGFIILDLLLDWCVQNEMYLILDMHGAPGGQGENADISDYDPSKPSLWESQENQDKLVALWKKLAERYSDEEWIGGYDLINETNWSFSDDNNAPLREIYGEITRAIRQVDNNHIIFIEGNWFANDFTGLTPPWDDNMVYSFHKYWNHNDQSSISWMIGMRNNYNIPIWLGETGENSNTWFTNCIKLCEENHIGWSMWPVKKPGINNPLRVKVNQGYSDLIRAWENGTEVTDQDAAFQAVMQFAENHKIENCVYQKNVVDAMIRQPHTTQTKPYADHTVNQPVFITEYDLGRNNQAYFDTDTANYNSSTGSYTAWNQGWSFRNDGVDIEACSDSDTSNGYNVGWTADGEWMQYTLSADSTAAYQLNIRHASSEGSSIIHFEINGNPITPQITLPATGGWQEWITTAVDSIIIPEGRHKIKLFIDQGGSNLNYFEFFNPFNHQNIDLKEIAAETSDEGNAIVLTLNRPVTSDISNVSGSDFTVTSDNRNIPVGSVSISPDDARVLQLDLEEQIYYGSTTTLSYQGTEIASNGHTLDAFTDIPVSNNLPVRYTLPGKVEAEDFNVNMGLALETCEDKGGGLNTAYANAGDYLDYCVYVTETGEYTVNFRVATIRTNAQIVLRTIKDGQTTPIDTVSFTSTGGWQYWETQSSHVKLEEGRYTLRIFINRGEHNLNWFEVTETTGIMQKNRNNPAQLIAYPNPVDNKVNIRLPLDAKGTLDIKIFDFTGRLVNAFQSQAKSIITLNVQDLDMGIYTILVKDDQEKLAQCKIIVK